MYIIKYISVHKAGPSKDYTGGGIRQISLRLVWALGGYIGVGWTSLSQEFINHSTELV